MKGRREGGRKGGREGGREGERRLTFRKVLHDFDDVLLGEQEDVTVGLGSDCSPTWDIVN